MVAKRELTDRFLRSIKPAPAGKRVIFWDTEVPGFGIRVTDKSREDSKGAFVLVMRFPGSANPAPRRIDDYPAMSLAEARERAREWRADVRRGIDPKVKEAAQRNQEARQRADTFGAVFDEFADDHLSRLRTGKAVRGIIAKHVSPIWGKRPISEIRRADVNELIRALRKDKPIGANRILAYLKTLFDWAVDQERIDASPAAGVKRPSKETKRDRVLSDWEIRAIWQACSELGVFGRALKVMLATGQRRGEVGAMTWRELDLKAKNWALARERTKANRAHDVPLSELVLSIITECPRVGDFVFSTGRSAPARKGGSTKSVAISGWGKVKNALDKLSLEKAQALATERGDDPPERIADWRVHDLRRTAATYMARLGVDRVALAKILNHADNEVIAVYDRHRYDCEKRRALDLWGERLAAIVNGDCGGNVVSIVAARVS